MINFFEREGWVREIIHVNRYVAFAETAGECGFYFWNETWSDLIGPFPSIQWAMLELNEYTKYLNRG